MRALLTSLVCVLALLLATFAAQAQEPPKDFTDPVALLKAVAKTHAAGVDTFRMESIAETTWNADLRHERRTVPYGNVSGGRNLGASVPLFPRVCAKVPGECRRCTQECVRHSLVRAEAYLKSFIPRVR